MQTFLRWHERSFEGCDDVGQADGRGWSRQGVAATGAAVTSYQRRAPERQQQLFQVGLRDALTLSDLGGVHGPLAVPASDFNHGVRDIVGAL